MKDFSKIYTEEDDGFNGNCDAYLINTNQINLLNWLTKEISESEKLYRIINELTDDILIIKNINIDEEFQGEGNGTEILNELINKSYTKAAILVCDIGESQKEGFILEKFYTKNNFKTIFNENNYPIMVYPTKLADSIIKKLNFEKKNIRKKIKL